MSRSMSTSKRSDRSSTPDSAICSVISTRARSVLWRTAGRDGCASSDTAGLELGEHLHRPRRPGACGGRPGAEGAPHPPQRRQGGGDVEPVHVAPVAGPYHPSPPPPLGAGPPHPPALTPPPRH